MNDIYLLLLNNIKQIHKLYINRTKYPPMSVLNFNILGKSVVINLLIKFLN